MSDPLVSVLIAAYNHEKYIQETIQSIIDQTYRNIELIIIDDGSKDNTYQKICDMKEVCERRFARVIFKTKQNGGPDSISNKLKRLANGEYVYLIASDDKAKPTAIETELKFLSTHEEYILCVGKNELIDSDSKICYWDQNKNLVYTKKQAKYLTHVDFLEHRKQFKFTTDDFGTYRTIVQENYIPNGYLIRKKVYDNIEFVQEAPLEDFYLMLQLSKFGKMKYIDEILFSYRQHSSNTMKQVKKVSDYGKETLLYEASIVNSMSDKKWKQIYYEVRHPKQMIINLGIFKIYKKRNLYSKIKILEIFNRRFILQIKKA